MHNRTTSSDLPPFSIDDIMRTPFPSCLTPSKTSCAAAWVFDERGVRNVWVSDPTSNEPARKLTGFFQDNGSNITDLAWSPDADRVAFTRGPSLDDMRDVNVNSAADGAKSATVWIADVTGRAPFPVGEGYAPSFSPKAGRLIFVKGSQIWMTSGSRSAEPAVLISDEGKIGATVWSPDGQRLAFVSRRAHHDIIGVYEFGSGAIVWLSPSLDHDVMPVFSPSGDEVAFIRVPDEKTAAYVSRKAGYPWSIWIANVFTGAGRLVWTADVGIGSVFTPTLSGQDLLWTKGDLLVFPWEKSGWLHLYRVSVNGGQASALTTGAYEVASIALSADGRTVVYSANPEEADRLQVWTSNPATGEAVRVAKGKSLEALPQTGAQGTIFALLSEATSPLRPVVLIDGGWQPLMPSAVQVGFPSAALVTPMAVRFKGRDGQIAFGQVFAPKEARHGDARPAVLFFHGGPRRQMFLGFHPMSAYNWMYALNLYLAAKGYVVLSVNYRGGTGYGLDYREADGFGPGGGSELNDLLGAIDYLKARGDVAPDKIGIWGASYGGLMAALGLARASEHLAAGVNYAGVYNWASFLASVGTPTEAGDPTARALASSPIASVQEWTSPMLVIHADNDQEVPSTQSTELIQDLRAQNVEHEVMLIPNEIHDLARYTSWMTLLEATTAYFDRTLERPAAGR